MSFTPSKVLVAPLAVLISWIAVFAIDADQDQNGATVAPRRQPMQHGDKVIGIAFSPDGKRLATGGWDNLVRLWDPETGKEVRRLSGHSAAVLTLAFSPDGNTLASAGNDRIVRLWDVASGQPLRQLTGHTSGIASIVFSPDGKLLASAGYDQTIQLWDPTTGKRLHILPGHEQIVYSLAFTPDGGSLVSGSADNTVRTWNVARGYEERRFQEGQGTVGAVAVSGDGRLLASGDYNGVVHIWDLRTGRKRRRFSAHQGWLGAMVFSPDSRTLITCGYDRAIRLWEIATGKERRQIREHREAVARLALSPGGTMLASAGFDKTIRLTDIVPSREERASAHPLADVKLNALWVELGSTDAGKAYAAMRQMALVPQQATALMAAHLHPSPVPVNTRSGGEWIADLDDNRFAVRQRATAELERMGERAEPALRKAQEENPSLEVRERIDHLMSRLQGRILSPEEVREVRAIELLEQIATPGTKQILEGLSHGERDSVQTQEAQASLQRLVRTSR
jgi:WD40 repeat protein